MEAKVKMKIVDDLFNDISEKVGRLHNSGVFIFEEGVKIIRAISDKEMEWMQNNFSDTEIYEFMNSRAI